MSQLSESQEVPQWLYRASQAVDRFRKQRKIRSYSALASVTGLTYRTVKKLNPDKINKSIQLDSVIKIFAKLVSYMEEEDGRPLDSDSNLEGLDREMALVIKEYYYPDKYAA